MENIDILNIINSLPKDLKSHFNYRDFNIDNPILTQGNRLDNVYILLDGIVKLCHSDIYNINYLIDIEAAISIFGEIEALSGNHTLTTVLPLTKCTTLEIPKSIFLKIITKYPNMSLSINKLFANRMYESWSREMKNVTLPLKYKVVYFILKIENKNLNIQITKKLIVEGVGSNIRSINRVIKELSSLNLINCSGGNITVPSISALKRYLDQLI